MKKGFKIYGIIAIIILVITQISLLFKIQPIANFYFPIIWFSYIFIIDSLVYKIKGSSLISNRLITFLGIVIISAFFWYIFELTNISVQNWNYLGSSGLGSLKDIFKILSFATVLPALFETTELILAIRLFDKQKLSKTFKISKSFLQTMMALGIIFFILPIFLPEFTFPLIWLSFFFFLDPINYLNNQPSIIGHIKSKKLAIPLSLLLSGIILGLFWEFWNYFAPVKWTYNIPYVGFLKIFEMPILGYLGYFPFALELYAMYFFIRSLFLKKEISLSKLS